jgi:hypothetical protein
MEDDFVVFAGRSRVFRPGGTAPPTPQAMPTPQDPTLPHEGHAVHDVADESMIGEWLARQEQYVGYDPHYIAAIEPPASASHDQHQHQHQHRQYGYAPEQPQYTLEAVPPPHYMTAPYATYAPPPHPPQQLVHAHRPPPTQTFIRRRMRREWGSNRMGSTLTRWRTCDATMRWPRAPHQGAGATRVRGEWVAHERDVAVVHAVAHRGQRARWSSGGLQYTKYPSYFFPFACIPFYWVLGFWYVLPSPHLVLRVVYHVSWLYIGLCIPHPCIVAQPFLPFLIIGPC